MTQQYTPVAWQDETTSQQGTLINAERLNQMQTAHHYADGFEEVDAIPTADPGVDYHKVVFCTADTTFYRWTGTEWVKDVDDTTAQELHDFEAQTATNLAGKVDKLTGSAADTYLYSHKGATQGHVLAIADAVANSVAVRDLTAAIQAEYSENGLNAKDLVNRLALNNATSSIWQGINTKADKATTLAGYNISDAYTKSETDSALADKVGIIPVTTGVKFYAQSSGGTSLYQGTANAQTGITSVPMRDSNGRIKTETPSADTDCANKKYTDDGLALKADKSDTYTKAQVDTALALKADQATTYSKTETDTLLNAKADKATTLAGYGIADAYTKSETDTLLTNGSVTKVGTSDVGTDTKPIKLVGGVPTAVTNDLVDTATAQTINGLKTIGGKTDRPVAHNDDKDFYTCNTLNARQNRGSSTVDLYPISIGKSNTNPHANVLFEDTPTSRKISARMYCVSTNGFQEAGLIDSASGVYASVPTPNASAPSTAVATVGYVADTNGLNNLVHTNGDETKTGNLTMSTGLITTERYPIKNLSNRIGATSLWAKLYSWDASSVQRGISFQAFSRNDARTAYYTAMGNTTNGSIHNDGSWTGLDAGFRLAYDGVGTISLFYNGQRKNFIVTDSGISNNTGVLAVTIEDATVDVGEPTVGPDYTWVVGVTA